MGRSVNEAKITTRNARSKLTPRKAPYWRSIDRGAHIGYAKGKNGGSWIARYNPVHSSYVTKTVGKADDRMPADGQNYLDYSQALQQVRAGLKNGAPIMAKMLKPISSIWCVCISTAC